MLKLVENEPNNGYSRIDHIPPLSDDELAAVVDHIGECCPEDFADFVSGEALGFWAIALRSPMLTPMTRNACLGEMLRSRLQASARSWLIAYADDECETSRRHQNEFDRKALERARLPGGDV